MVPSYHTIYYGKENHEKPIKIISDIQNSNTNTYSVTIKMMKYYRHVGNR
jgi:hypothetical protein